MLALARSLSLSLCLLLKTKENMKDIRKVITSVTTELWDFTYLLHSVVAGFEIKRMFS